MAENNDNGPKKEGNGDGWFGTDFGLGDFFEGLVRYGVPAGISYFANRGDKKVSNEATRQQMDLARALMQMQQQQFAVDLPFRKALFNRINQRQQRQQPRIMPGRAPLSNPYRNVRRVNPFDLSSVQSRTRTTGQTGQNPLASLLRGQAPQTRNALANIKRQFAGIPAPTPRPMDQPNDTVPNSFN